MYQGMLRPAFQPDGAAMHHQREREEYLRRLHSPERSPRAEPEEKPASVPRETPNLAALLEAVSPEDSALIALIVFLLCDNTNNDVVLLGILLYILLT